MMAHLNKHPVKYLEKPVTVDEKEIAVLLENLVDAFINNNLEKFKSIFSFKAAIFLLPTEKNPISVTECIGRLKKIAGNVRNISYENVFIRINGYQAIVSAIRNNFSMVQTSNRAIRYFKCEKENNIWKITEANFA